MNCKFLPSHETFLENVLFFSQENQEKMEDVQKKIRQLQEMKGTMEGVDGVDPKEFSEIQAEVQDLNTRWITVTNDVDNEEQR